MLVELLALGWSQGGGPSLYGGGTDAVPDMSEGGPSPAWRALSGAWSQVSAGPRWSGRVWYITDLSRVRKWKELYETHNVKVHQRLREK